MRRDSDPTPIDPPAGEVEVYVYDPAKQVAERTLWCGEDLGRATTAMRKAAGHACIARGGVVCSIKYGVPASLHAAIKAAVKASHDAARAVEVTHAISPATGVPDFEGDDEEAAPAPKTRRAPKAKAAVDEDPLCTNCEQEPRARATRVTRPEELTWGARCRKATCERRRKDAAKPSAARVKKTKKTSKQKVGKLVAPKRSTDPGEVLFEVLSDLRGHQLTEERVREMVREELATIFASLRGRT